MDKIGHEVSLLDRKSKFEFPQPQEITVVLECNTQHKNILVPKAISMEDAYIQADTLMYQEGYTSRKLLNIDYGRKGEDLIEITEETTFGNPNVIDIIEYHTVKGTLVTIEGKVNGKSRDIIAIMDEEGEEVILTPIAIGLTKEDRVELEDLEEVK